MTAQKIVVFLLCLIFVISKQEMDEKRLQYRHSHYHEFNISILSELENLGELFNDKAQRDSERHGKVNDEFQRLKPSFPCVTGVTPLGSIIGSHKFTCGLHAISSNPIVYSFGSNQQQDFELAILRLRPDAKIFHV